jgi:divalent metal cation (Fe/Co/Zn/Cd) transporter
LKYKPLIAQTDLKYRAIVLAYITIFYNLAEGIVSVYFGLEDETLSLFGFGLDSFVEVISGVGVLHMLLRVKSTGEIRDEFEKRALKITGTGFYLLAAGIIFTAIYNLVINHKPETTFWGVIISLISIFTMTMLIYFKKKVGRALKSDALIADANCTKTCLYLSIILLVSSIAYEFFKIGGIDSIGALLISYFSFKEGKEAFAKSKTNTYCSCED